MTRLAKLLVALPLLAASCATATDQPEIATRVSAIAVPGLTPVPCCAKTAPKNVVCGVPSSTTGNVESKWDGTQIDLVVADAFAACMMDPVTGQFATAELGTDYTTDDYLQQIKAHIAHAAPKNSPPWKSGIDNRPWYQAWIELRAERLYNCDPITLANNQAVILEPVGVKERIVNPTASPALDQASGLLRVAGVNLCIAQKMRQLAPGASSGEALLLGEAEQRQLLDTIRQRVQIAMLHYAALGVLFSAPRNPGATGLLASVQTWAAQCADNAIPGCSGDPRAHLFAMGRDFAAAVQLHVAVSEELLSLLARSRGARLPTDRVGQNRGDELWGAGSWYQRLLAAAFGGQALAVRDDGPWLHPTGSQQPGDVPYASGKGLPGWGFDWPEYSAHPHFQRDVLEPQVWELWSLARSHDAVRLVVQEESCNALLEQESADFLYKSVETQLRKDTCFKPVTGGPCGSGGTCGVGFNCDDVTNTCTGCETSDTVLEPTLAFPNEKYVLWEQHRITPQHARQLVEFLIRAVDYAAVPPATDITYPGQLPPICNGGQWWAWPMAEDKSIDTRAGAVNATRSLTFESMTSPTGKVLHIHRDEVFAQRSLEDDAPRFTRYGTQTFMAPWEVNPLVTYGWAGQGPMPGLTNHFRDASLGSVSALAATRQMLMWSMAYLTDKAYTQQTFPELPRLTDYFAEGRRVIETINGAIGTSSVNVRPALEVKGDTLLVAEFVPEPSVFLSTYYVEGTYGADDAFWQPGPGVAWGVCAAHSPLAGNLVSAPTISLYGQTLEQVINLAYGNHECGLVLPQNPTLDSYYGATPRRWAAFMPLDDEKTHTIFAVRFDSDGVQARLLGANLRFDVDHLEEGQYIATGGKLGGLIQEQRVVTPHNPVRPAFDAFGLPHDWSPQYTPDLSGGINSEDAPAQYMKLAKQAASSATAAVEKAVDGLVQDYESEQQLAADSALATVAFKEALAASCGAASDTCEVKLTRTTPSIDWYPGVQAPVPNTVCASAPDPETQPSVAIYCVIEEVVNAVLTTEVQVANPVLAQIKASKAPAFSEYAGGELQTAFIEQWTALKAPSENLKSLYASWKAADAQVELAEKILESKQKLKDLNCSAGTMRKALLQGLSASAGLNLGGKGGTGVGFGLSWSPGPWLAQKHKCEELKLELPPAQQQVVVSALSGYAGIVSAISGTTDSIARIQESAARIQQILQSAGLAKSRFELESSLAASGSRTSFGLHRRYRAYDLWRAKALVEGARRYALAARRSIESRYVVDLSAITEPEPFVQSPSTWADEVYGYDLSLPKAVGLAVGTPVPGGIYANKIEDYVANLEAFTAGFTLNRPSAVAQSDIDVITLPGLAAGEASNVDGQDLYLQRGEWFMLCVQDGGNGPGVWTAVKPTDGTGTFCSPGSHPVRARLRFLLDPWGRLNKGISSEPYDLRYNARWGLIAVNFVGTGVKDCKKAADPLACYNEGFIRYGLTQTGPAYVTDFGGAWHTAALPIGRIEGAKGLAAELWLDPLKDGWNTQYVGAVSRTELQVRPFGGAYELEFEVLPEVVLDRIERVQVLAGSSYWVAQE